MVVDCDLSNPSRYTTVYKNLVTMVRKTVIVAEKNFLENVGNYTI